MWKLRKTSHTHQAKHYRLHCSACWRRLMFGTNIACKLLGRRGCAWAGLCPPAQWSRGSSLGMDSGADTWITTQVIWIFLVKWKFCSSHRQSVYFYSFVIITLSKTMWSGGRNLFMGGKALVVIIYDICDPKSEYFGGICFSVLINWRKKCVNCYDKSV